MLRLGRDLLDQQIIDVTGRKVVRVNDLTLELHHDGVRDTLTVSDVDVGIRSILRRLLQGVLPPRWIRWLQQPIPPNSIRWEFCNVVEPDPQRRLRLNISYQKLEQMHPADLADIVEDLAPAEREAIFETIDSEVAADALSEIDPKMQASILESLEPEKAADIVEEMAPDEAADALSELEAETSEEILDEMDSAPKIGGARAAGVRRRHRRRHDEYRVRGSARRCLRNGRIRRPKGQRGAAGEPQYAVPDRRRRPAFGGDSAGAAVYRVGNGSPAATWPPKP